MRPKSSELFDQITMPTRGLLGSLGEEQKQLEQDEGALELLREQHLDSRLDSKID